MTRKIIALMWVVLMAVAVMADGLPMVSITVDSPLNATSKVAAQMQAGDYNGRIGIKLRGNSSLSFNQKKYTIELRDDEDRELSAPLFDMPAHSDWVLLAPYNDVSMVRDPLAFSLWRDMGHWGPRTKMVELTVNGDYRGIYILSEAIKRGAERVNVAKLRKSDISGRELTGGYILRIDTYNEDDATFTSKVPGIGEGIMTSEIVWSCIYPKKKKLQPEQFAYIQAYVDSVEQVIQSDRFADPYTGYAQLIDVPSFVDYFIHTELSMNADGYKRSAYFYKEKQQADGTGGKLVAGPVWDYNLAYGNCNFANANNAEAWCYEGANTNPTPAIWQRLLQDPAFRKAVKQRYQELRKGALGNQAIMGYIDAHAKTVASGLKHHFEKYPELLVSEEEKIQASSLQNIQTPPLPLPSEGRGGAAQPIPGGFPMMGGGFPMMPGGFPPMMGDSLAMGGGFPMMPGGFPPMMGDSLAMGGGFPMMPGGFPPMMGDSLAMGGGFPMMPGGFPPMGEGFGDGGFGFGYAVGMFAAYRVSSYDEEIATLKQWLADRLAFLDREINRFDKDFEPHIQPLKEIKPQFGGFPFQFQFPVQ